MDAGHPVISILRNPPVRGSDLAIVSIDAQGTEGELNRSVLREFNLPPDVLPRADLLRGGYHFFSSPRVTLLFVVTIGHGEAQDLLRENLKGALRAIPTRGQRYRSMWIPLLGTGVAGLSVSAAVDVIARALRDTLPDWREHVENVALSIPLGKFLTEADEAALRSIFDGGEALIQKSVVRRGRRRPIDETKIEEKVENTYSNASVASNTENQAPPTNLTDEGGASSVVDPEPAPQPLAIAGFSSDRAAVAFGQRRVGGDPLRIEADVQAFARLICLEEAQPPLSIGLFGGWGSGKSTFMGRLETAIDDIVDAEQKRRGRVDKPEAAPTQSRFVQRVVQIRFNAWHFADASLWASLTAEFFDQLRSGGFARQGQEIHARLVERVNAHVHSLSQTLASTRAALAEGEKQVVDAQKARNEAVAEAREAEGDKLSQTLVDAVAGAYERHKVDLKEMGRRAYQDDVPKGIDDFVAVAKQVQTIGGQVAAVWKTVRAGQWRWVLLIAAVVLVLAGIAALPLVDMVAATNLTTLLGGWSALAGLASAAGALLPAIRIVASIAKDTAAFADKLKTVSEQNLKKVVAREAELAAAVKEAQARREAVDRAARALARYIDPQGVANPPRLLRFVLEDDPDTKAMEKEIGLIGRARRLFQAVDEIVKEERRKRLAGEPSDLEVPDRIILYIDDLDRCTYAQVYAVLQAIHLLLAFELFVVVVGVDVKWIQDALAAQAGAMQQDEGGKTAAAVDLERRERAIAYLEKIFQLPFWLRPLDIAADGDGSYGAYVQALLAPNLEAPQANVFKSAIPPLKRALGAGTADEAPPPRRDEAGDEQAPAKDDEAAAEDAWIESTFALDQALATVRLSKSEVDFLASDAIGRIAAKEPRAVKRLVNVYRIVRARLAGEQLLELLGEGERAATYPFIILIAAIETGQPVRVADGFYAALKSLDQNLVLDEAVLTKRPSKDETFDVSEVWRRLDALRAPFDASPGLPVAIAAACAERGGRGIKVADCLSLARKVRRYSFNRYH